MTLDELDRLHAADAERIREELRTTGRHYTEPHEYLHNAWPSFSARLRAAEAEVERLRGEVAEQRALLRWFLDGDDHTHEDDCGARGQHDRDVCRNEASQCHNMCEGPHCTCDATEMRDAARAALGEP